ncbi:conserved hypothetical protein [Candidatus Liberibacter solanacearum]|uniref:Trm112 family protein n=1 Tax=Candidatus Liberibacter solanacearum TaxID=556287 RepID=UPI0038711F0A
MKENVPNIDPRLLEILVCPLTKSNLILISEGKELLSKKASLVYPIRSGVPIMLVAEARKMDTKD